METHKKVFSSSKFFSTLQCSEERKPEKVA